MGQLEQAKNQVRQIMPQFYTSSVSHEAATKTTNNITGDETFSYAAAATLSVYIVRKNRPWFLDKAGLIEGGDAIMLVPYGTTVSKNDKITWNSNTYRIHTVLNRDMLGGDTAYKTVNLFLI
jgi:hypothetical protein